MGEKRRPWYLLTGLILGAVAGLLYAWLISPVRYVETAPNSLRADFKDSYRAMIAVAFAADADVGRASSRLALLGDPNPAQALAAQAQQILAQGGSQDDARALALLAAALADQPAASATPTVSPTVVHSPTPTRLTATEQTQATSGPSPTASVTLTPAVTIVAVSVTPTIELSPTRTALTPTRQTGTPPPTFTPSPTIGAPFALQERSKVCDQTAAQPMLQVQINDAAGNPVAGVEIDLSWQAGEDVFFTGLMPSVSPGFADYRMTAGISYTLHLTDGGQPVSDLAAVECTSSQGTTYWGGWYLLFQQP